MSIQTSNGIKKIASSTATTGEEKADAFCETSDGCLAEESPFAPPNTRYAFNRSQNEHRPLLHQHCCQRKSETVAPGTPSDLYRAPSSREWYIGNRAISKSLIMYCAQIILLYAVVATAIVNLSLSHCMADQKLWVALLASSIGYLLPSPSIKESTFDRSQVASQR